MKYRPFIQVAIMFEIAGGILLAVLLLATIEFWLPFDFWILIAGVAIAIIGASLLAFGFGLQGLSGFLGKETTSLIFSVLLFTTLTSLFSYKCWKNPGLFSHTIRTIIYALVTLVAAIGAIFSPIMLVFSLLLSFGSGVSHNPALKGASWLELILFIPATFCGFYLLHLLGKNLYRLRAFLQLDMVTPD